MQKGDSDCCSVYCAALLVMMTSSRTLPSLDSNHLHLTDVDCTNNVMTMKVIRKAMIHAEAEEPEGRASRKHTTSKRDRDHNMLHYNYKLANN